MRKRYEDRILVPINGGTLILLTNAKLRIANGYERVVFQKKPFLEISRKNICADNISIPYLQKWRENSIESGWVEYRSKDYCKIKIIYDKQKQKFYCSIFDLHSKEKPSLIEKLTRKGII
jgi:hypothetical protein